MTRSLNIFFYLFVLLLVWGCPSPQLVFLERPSSWAQKIDSTSLQNIYKVDDDLFRSEQPHALAMAQVEKLGIKTVLNLRRHRNDHAPNTKLVLEHVHINAFTISYAEVVKSLQVIDRSEKPVLVHCTHGSDRTGCVVAAYRMVECGWTKEQAIQELMRGGYGYHEKWFPNIVRLLNSIDVEKLKKDVRS